MYLLLVEIIQMREGSGEWFHGSKHVQAIIVVFLSLPFLSLILFFFISAVLSHLIVVDESVSIAE